MIFAVYVASRPCYNRSLQIEYPATLYMDVHQLWQQLLLISASRSMYKNGTPSYGS
jgi:hypothetical protein